MVYTVQQLANLSGVSVRTLHYYDQIGLLKPSFVSENGYRKYEQGELVRLQQILFFRELDFPLEKIRQILENPSFNTLEALRDQKRMLEMEKQRVEKLLDTITSSITHMKQNTSMKDEDLYGGLSKKQMEEYQQEAQERWGDTDAYKQSVQRTKNWTKEDYKKVAEAGNKLTQELADAMDKGTTSPEVQALIEQHYQGIQVFYDCSYEMYRGLGRLYVDDSRFTAFYDTFRPGLAKFMQEAIAYYCDIHEQ